MSVDEGSVVAVVGGGPIGSLQAIFLARRGYKVVIFESRDDARKLVSGGGRSINLALSLRGITSLKAVGCDEAILSLTVPMYGRMIHSLNGKMTPQLYSSKGEAILSIDRLKLNQHLLDVADSHPNIEIFFKHRLIRADFKNQILAVNTADEGEKDFKVGFTFGCDGAYSTVRRQMARWDRLNYQQEYIEHGYKELTMPPGPDGDYAMPPNYLHIWPRNEFMMIALPNLDKSFTVTLYMPYTFFDGLNTKEDVSSFFEKYFPDAIERLGAENLLQDFFKNPLSTFMSVKCRPHYLGSRALVMGDAAHAVVPFFGQGMNVGMEDCLIFDELFVEDDDPIESLHKTAQLYSDNRWKDAHAIADLSMYNYIEMRSHVASPLFRLRKYIDNWIHYLFPSYFSTLYSMVSFSRTPYHKAIEINQRQNLIIRRGLSLIVLGVTGVSIYCIFRYYRLFNVRSIIM
jgi:kynurenine 3-monooxygenase